MKSQSELRFRQWEIIKVTIGQIKPFLGKHWVGISKEWNMCAVKAKKKKNSSNKYSIIRVLISWIYAVIVIFYILNDLEALINIVLLKKIQECY